ncbi:MAG: hypothetical protein V4636_13075 [Pseudomonadota bacterium]
MNDSNLDRLTPVIKRGDVVRFKTRAGNVRRAIVTHTDVEVTGRAMFECLILEEPERGHFHWEYFDQAIDISRTALPMVVTFRCNGTAVDRIRVIADDDDDAIEKARAVVLARSRLDRYAVPELHDPVVGVDVTALRWLQ